MLDKLPAWARHFILLLLVAGLTMLQDKLDVLNIPAELVPLVAVAITALLVTLTPLTRQYGVGADGAVLDDGSVDSLGTLPVITPSEPFVEDPAAPVDGV